MKRRRGQDGTDLSSTINRGWAELRRSQEQCGQEEWVHLRTRGAGTDEVFGVYQHKPCGTVVEVMQGYFADICPKCQPEQWAKTHGKK